ncbi:MAG: signal peptidase I [Ignavibacteriae bacterium]|nr:signal peptidase I [Ignavibacteriota bacterium]MCB9206268.1 signal peptidase I [Ignavibacteriales bacterium]MCB9209104.1 signal peptidase I [Ignavibacteriales bacterium]MCB9217975.1 signal peptidase I [Ignavibacteriales bacterium]MCB9260364.1 signal peptidase I [Ignavibacteriales bacterium]
MTTSKEERKKQKVQKKLSRTPLQKFLDFWKNLFFAAIAALLIKTFLIETSRVPTGSMEKTIMVGDFLFVNKFIYGSSSPRNIPFTNVVLPYFQLPAISEPEKGDIIVFEYPGDRDVITPTEILNYVKRCVGEPGDTIEIKNKVVYVNGKELHKPSHIQYLMPRILPKSYTRPDIFPKGSGWNKDQYGPLVIPKKGDKIKLTAENIEIYRTLINRTYSKEVVSVQNGSVLINGKVVDEYEIPQDYYFAMGDNRDDSADSRYWGFVPREKIVGEALMIYWSWNPNISFGDFFKLLGSTRFNRIAKLVH